MAGRAHPGSPLISPLAVGGVTAGMGLGVICCPQARGLSSEWMVRRREAETQWGDAPSNGRRAYNAPPQAGAGAEFRGKGRLEAAAGPPLPRPAALNAPGAEGTQQKETGWGTEVPAPPRRDWAWQRTFRGRIRCEEAGPAAARILSILGCLPGRPDDRWGTEGHVQGGTQSVSEEEEELQR